MYAFKKKIIKMMVLQQTTGNAALKRKRYPDVIM